MVAGDLEGYDGAAIRDRGHLRWKIENNAFTLFHAFAILQGKLFRLGKVTRQELRKQIYRSLLCGSPMPFFSG